VLTAGCAKLAYGSSRTFAERWWNRMGFTWDAFEEFDSMKPQMPT
jgi:hypothetical protein